MLVNIHCSTAHCIYTDKTLGTYDFADIILLIENAVHPSDITMADCQFKLGDINRNMELEISDIVSVRKLRPKSAPLSLI